MLKTILTLLLIPALIQAQSSADIARWKQSASRVEIVRDQWGIPHIYGKTDADAVFGLLYAQCEDDFKRVEMNYIEKHGRLAEVNGERDLYNDLLVRLVIDPRDARADYGNSPAWLKKLLNAFADGVNYYLYTHPSTKPALLKKFEPWFPLLWTDGSIGAITTAGLGASDLQALYGKLASKPTAAVPRKPELYTGSNGFAVAPKITEGKNAMLYINPHVTFYFRPEVQVTSEEGLNVYGAVTWGQFFVYQGFNAHCGWMHTSSQVDVSDAYIEEIQDRGGNLTYSYNKKQMPVKVRRMQLQYKSGDSMATLNVPAMFTHHGPVMARRDSAYLSVRSFNRSLVSLQQSWLRTKATSFAEFRKVLDLRGNTSNNTVYADAEGNIAYWHGNYVPRRDTSFNWNKPVDGTIPATEWKGLHPVTDIIQSVNPTNGWIQNCNSTPFTVAGTNSPHKADYPSYMSPDKENFRAVTAMRVLAARKDFTIDRLIAAGYDPTIAFFEKLVPAVKRAYDNHPNDSLKAQLKEPVELFSQWDLKSGLTSTGTPIAVTWADILMGAMNGHASLDEFDDQVSRTNAFAENSANDELILSTFAQAIQTLQSRYGNWKIEWGTINRFQRINNELEPTFDDNKPSIPIAFASSQWGQLASYYSASFNGTKKLYGVYGNSFICAVEFGKRIRAKSLLAGGESGDPKSKHFADQSEMYARGEFKDVLFYKEDVLKHAEKTYHPGE